MQWQHRHSTWRALVQDDNHAAEPGEAGNNSEASRTSQLTERLQPLERMVDTRAQATDTVGLNAQIKHLQTENRTLRTENQTLRTEMRNMHSSSECDEIHDGTQERFQKTPKEMPSSSECDERHNKAKEEDEAQIRTIRKNDKDKFALSEKNALINHNLTMDKAHDEVVRNLRIQHSIDRKEWCRGSASETAS